MLQLKEVEKRSAIANGGANTSCHSPSCHAPCCHAPACHGPAERGDLLSGEAKR
ncbi:MAG: hypothetical protein ACP5IL_02615 [Syntrophobacteraceae bacterium]